MSNRLRVWIASHWRHERLRKLDRVLFEYRHYRRLAPLIAILCGFTLVWCVIVIALGLLLGGFHLIWQQAFAQNVIASLLVLPLGLTIGVAVGTLLQEHSLRFQVRHAGDRLGDCVRSATFTFILFLRNACGITIDVAGPINCRLIQSARDSAQNSFVESDWAWPLPPDFDFKLEETVNSLASCFRNFSDLRMAFPHSFDLMRDLEATILSIKAGHSHSDPRNTALIVLHFAGEMIGDLE